jgi:hypothetical protein
MKTMTLTTQEKPATNQTATWRRQREFFKLSIRNLLVRKKQT